MAELLLPRSWRNCIDVLWYQRWPTDPETWKEVLQLAEAQHLTGALGFVTMDAPSDLPPAVAERLRIARYEAEARYGQAEIVVKELGALVQELRLEAVLFKGFVLAQAYPYPPARFFGDIDILLPGDEAQQRLVAALLPRGYASAPDVHVGDSHHHYPRLAPPWSGTQVEVHRRLGREGGFETTERMAEVWQRARPCEPFPPFLMLDPVDHYLFAVYHAVHAHWFELGLRSFYDLYWFTRDWDAATWQTVVTRAEAWRVTGALRLAWGMQCWLEGRSWEQHPAAAYLAPPPQDVLRAAQLVMIQDKQTELDHIWRSKRLPGLRGWLAYLRLTITLDGTLPWYRWPGRMRELAQRLLRSLWRWARQGDPVAAGYRRLHAWLREGQ